MESTPNERKAFTDYLHGQQDGSGPRPSGPTRPGAKLTQGISARLRGDQAPSDTPDAPAGIDQDVFDRAVAAAKDPADPEYEMANAVVILAQRLADAQDQNGAPA